jgi:inositol 1,4,5-triphosphate receptor type 1/inositol 1,4,5-triphosphate receptor type 3
MFVISGIVMIVCSMFVVFFFVMKKGPLYVKEAWNKSKNLINKDQNWFVRAFFTLFTIGYCLIRVLMNIDLIYYFAYGACAIIATRFHFFFFAFHLSEVVLRYPTLRNIIKSFWEPKTALLLTFILVMLMNYFFTLFAYMSMPELYNNSKAN